MLVDKKRTTQVVRRQYEDLPYPPREPEHESARLIRTYLDHLSLLNHYCFKGRQDFHGRFRILVAGGGTGDAVMYLGEQLRETDAEIVYVDLSESCMDIAKRRAAIRRLTNVTWLRGSLLDLPEMGLPPFDYINCVGVLHHLEEPEAGLKALRAVLKDDGAMGLMVYARYGRAGVYQMQELMRIVNRDEDDHQGKLDNAKAVLNALPETNWFKKAEHLTPDHREMGDAGIYDLLLHSTDKAYSVPELYDFLDTCRLHLATFMSPAKALYAPEVACKDQRMLDILKRLSTKDQQAALELRCGTVIKHSFYACPRPDTVAGLEDLDQVPFFHLLPNLGERLCQELREHPDLKHIAANFPRDVRLEIDVGKYTRVLLKHMDGKRPLKEIILLAGREHPASPSRDALLAEFRPLYERFNLGDLLLLRHVSSQPPPPLDPLGGT
ncbi:hypothetical protein LCGC14_2117360 [marine sediment metagenome]|uniref:Methyltransferase type 12 domain-containing protein n=1 Tax=marine sediment metagenome TaxID=412755 RepID=A0A0F9H1I4_9ZZZZ